MPVRNSGYYGDTSNYFSILEQFLARGVGLYLRQRFVGKLGELAELREQKGPSAAPHSPQSQSQRRLLLEFPIPKFGAFAN